MKLSPKLLHPLLPIKSIIISIAISILYIFANQLHNIEIVRNYVEDKAFDTIFYAPMIGLSSKEQTLQDAPNVLLVEIDNKFLSENTLINSKNEPTYGYLFPRSKLADIIDRLDAVSEKLNIKAIFLDYDLSFTMLPNGKEFSGEDDKLLQALSKPRNYKIIIPITYSQNAFYERLKNLPWISPTSVSLAYSSDGISRRFAAFDSNYTTASLEMYAIAKGCKNGKIENDRLLLCDKEFPKQDVVANRILIKTTGMQNGSGYSAWQNMNIVSASMLENIDYERSEVKNGLFVLIGAGYYHSNDIFNTPSPAQAQFGIEMHANALMTHFYLNGTLKQIPLLLGVAIVFVISFCINYFFDFLGYKFKSIQKEFLVVASLLTMSTAMFVLSYIFLVYAKVWLNWIIPFILFGALEALEFVAKYFKKIIKKA